MKMTSTSHEPLLPDDETIGSAPVAAADCAQPSSSLPIHDTQTAPITPRVNEGPLTNLGGDAIFLSTTGDGNFVDLTKLRGS